MVRHAQTELPNECCGLLAGVRDGEVLRVSAWHPLVNELASPTRYHSKAESLLVAHHAMQDADHEVVAIYHSHPTSEPIPSETDLEQNFYGDTVVHFII